MLANVRFQIERHYSSMPIMVIRLILTQGARSGGLHNQTCSSHTLARLCLAQCEPRVQLSLSQALLLH